VHRRAHAPVGAAHQPFRRGGDAIHSLDGMHRIRR
jgi:hypothetical protein